MLGTRRIGHAGTLDPLAEGVLPLALGRATRLIDRLEGDKEYFAEIVLGTRTTTDDAWGAVVERRVVPPISASTIERALFEFVGDIEQRPPDYSAVKVDGRRAYALARAGREVALATRHVTIHTIEQLGWDSPVLMLWLRCSRGTYVRALARDLGARLGVGGSLQRLVRLRVGSFKLAQASCTSELVEHGVALVLPADIVSRQAPAIVLDASQTGFVRHGRTWPLNSRGADDARAYDEDGRLVGFLTSQQGQWQPRLRLLD